MQRALRRGSACTTIRTLTAASESTSRILVLGDGHAPSAAPTGAERQAFALARALQGHRAAPLLHRPLSSRWWPCRAAAKLVGDAWLAAGGVRPALYLRSIGYVAGKGAELRSGLPGEDMVDVVLIAGTSQSPAGVAIRQALYPRAKLVQLLHPRHAGACFDVVVAPEHDFGPGDPLGDAPHVVRTRGSLHDNFSADEGPDGRVVAGIAGEAPEPRLAVLLGGPRGGLSRLLRWSAVSAQVYARTVAAFACASGLSVVVTVSRRTPRKYAAQFRDTLVSCLGSSGQVACDFDGSRDFYIAMLSSCSAIAVTSDSVNMLSEAIAVNVPVYVDSMPLFSRRLERFRSGLAKQGLVTLLREDNAATLGAKTPVRGRDRNRGKNDLHDVATAVQHLLESS